MKRRLALGTRHQASNQMVLNVFSKVLLSERHFNLLHWSYSCLASAWLLAVFWVAAFALIKSFYDSAFNPYLILTLICLGGALVNLILWNQDLKQHEEMLRAFFVKGQDFDQHYLWVPQVYDQISQLAPRIQVKLASFYLVPNLTLLSISGWALLRWMVSLQGALGWLAWIESSLVLITIILLVLLAVKLWRATLREPSEESPKNRIRMSGQLSRPASPYRVPSRPPGREIISALSRRRRGGTPPAWVGPPGTPGIR